MCRFQGCEPSKKDRDLCKDSQDANPQKEWHYCKQAREKHFLQGVPNSMTSTKSLIT